MADVVRADDADPLGRLGEARRLVGVGVASGVGVVVTCFYCAHQVYVEGVCKAHWVRFLRTTYGVERARYATRQTPAVAGTFRRN